MNFFHLTVKNRDFIHFNKHEFGWGRGGSSTFKNIIFWSYTVFLNIVFQNILILNHNAALALLVPLAVVEIFHDNSFQHDPKLKLVLLISNNTFESMMYEYSEQIFREKVFSYLKSHRFFPFVKQFTK